MRIARAAGMPLRIAAKIPRGETVYFKKQLEPHIDSRAFQLVGEVDEAMACGTPKCRERFSSRYILLRMKCIPF
jgi:hypothetical protein